MSNKVNKVKDDVLSGELLPLIYPKKQQNSYLRKYRNKRNVFIRERKKGYFRERLDIESNETKPNVRNLWVRVKNTTQEITVLEWLINKYNINEIYEKSLNNCWKEYTAEKCVLIRYDFNRTRVDFKRKFYENLNNWIHNDVITRSMGYEKRKVNTQFKKNFNILVISNIDMPKEVCSSLVQLEYNNLK